MVKPEDVLKDGQSFIETKDGTPARKGTVAAIMLNARTLDHLLRQPSARQSEISQVLADVRSLVPTLHAIQLFDFFTPLEWLQTTPKFQEGRSLIAILYLQQYPERVDQEIYAQLHRIKEMASGITQKEIEQLIPKP